MLGTRIELALAAWNFDIVQVDMTAAMDVVELLQPSLLCLWFVSSMAFFLLLRILCDKPFSCVRGCKYALVVGMKNI